MLACWCDSVGSFLHCVILRLSQLNGKEMDASQIQIHPSSLSPHYLLHSTETLLIPFSISHLRIF